MGQNAKPSHTSLNGMFREIAMEGAFLSSPCLGQQPAHGFTMFPALDLIVPFHESWEKLSGLLTTKGYLDDFGCIRVSGPLLNFETITIKMDSTWFTCFRLIWLENPPGKLPNAVELRARSEASGSRWGIGAGTQQ